MTMRKRPLVVVGVDGSRSSTEALRWAVEYAERADGHVEAVHAIEPKPFGALVQPHYHERGVTREDRRLAGLMLEAQLAKVRELLGRDPVVPVALRVRVGVPDLVLLHAAKAGALLAVGATSSRVGRVVLGSVSSAVVRHATCPVVVVPDAATAAREAESRHGRRVDHVTPPRRVKHYAEPYV